MRLSRWQVPIWFKTGVQGCRLSEKAWGSWLQVGKSWSKNDNKNLSYQPFGWRPAWVHATTNEQKWRGEDDDSRPTPERDDDPRTAPERDDDSRLAPERENHPCPAFQDGPGRTQGSLGVPGMILSLKVLLSTLCDLLAPGTTCWGGRGWWEWWGCSRAWAPWLWVETLQHIGHHGDVRWAGA